MRTLPVVVAVVLSLVWLTVAALAQSEPKKSPLGLPMPPPSTSAQNDITGTPSLTTRVWLWVLGMQQKLTRDMAAAVKDLKSAGTVHAAWVLALISFTYGVLHAAGPGHGKAVISSYVLANERTVRRGIFLSFLAALFQAISAVVIVGILAIALNATSLTIKATEGWLETLSWGLVAAIGGWMLYGQAAKLLEKRTARSHTDNHQPHHDGCCGHDHDQSHSHAHAHSGHGHDACWGHAHMPEPKDLEGDLTWSKAMAIAASVGIRPCTGAILVLIFALSQGLLWAGVFATFAMALGTAITTSALASLAVGSRDLAMRYSGEGSRWAENIGTAAGLAGSGAVLLIGLAFFIASFNSPAPF